MRGRKDYEELAEHLKRITALDQVMGLLGWDQETQMPPKGAAQRAEQAGAVAAALHAATADPRIADWCDAIDTDGAPAHVAVNVTEARTLHRRATRTPEKLAVELARQASKTLVVWQETRKTSNFTGYAPALSELIDLKREQAKCLAEEGETPYDALLAQFEPGTTSAELDIIFSRLRDGLVSLRQRIVETGISPPNFTGEFPADHQIAFSRKLGDIFGYDWQAGRLDLAVHPSSNGSGGDVRITTRINPTQPLECIYSTIHELGHAVYEQNLNPEHAMLPVASHASMGVHESQSRLFENQIGRGRAFCGWLHDAMVARFGPTGLDSAEDLYRAANAVETGFIRTEADEVHYNLHILMRFDLERALISGDLPVADLETAWNARFEADFGLKVPDALRGVMQDIHWADGLFGYFPTYTLGNIYAGCLNRAIHADMPDIDMALSQGETQGVVAWLNRNIHYRGRMVPPKQLITDATGFEPDETPLLDYLETKFSGLYPI